MRRMMIVLAFLCALSKAYCQNSKKTLEQFNVQSYGSTNVAEAKATIGKDEELTLFNLSSYKYTLTPEKNKEYKEYQVIKLDGLSNRDIVVGMVTNSLDRENRYIELAQGKEQLAMVREALDGKADYIFVSPFEKEYFIAADGTFRYIDGRDLVGSKKVKTYLEKGKPVTATTFFFALKDKGLIGSEVSLRNFISLNTEEKVNLLGMGVYASPKEPENETILSELH